MRRPILGRRLSQSGEIIQLTVSSDVQNFQLWQRIVADDSEDGLMVRSGSTRVIALDIVEGTIRLERPWNIPGFCDGDYLFAYDPVLYPQPGSLEDELAGRVTRLEAEVKRLK